MEKIFNEIVKERFAQDAKYGGASHDDTHNSFDWVAYIVKHLGRAVVYGDDSGLWDHKVFRYQMIRVAALAVAAVEWIDRAESNKNFADI